MGGTILSNALAVLAARGEDPVASATFLTTLIDFTDTGILDVFIDEAFVQFRELQMGQGGMMKGQDLASTFSFLRPTTWCGTTWWATTSGRDAAAVRPALLEQRQHQPAGAVLCLVPAQHVPRNNLIKPGKLTVCGEDRPGQGQAPGVCLWLARGPHRPHQCGLCQHAGAAGKKRFVMGASGHIAGVINPPAKGKRSHWIRADGKLPKTLDAWLEAPRNTRAAGGPTGPAGSRAIPARKLLRPRPTARAASSEPSSPRRAATLSKKS